MMSMAGMNGTMLWNWETIDACFLSESWKIKSQGGFAGLCIGVILLVVFLEGLRWAAKLYDQYLDAQHKKSIAMATVHDSSSNGGNKANHPGKQNHSSESLDAKGQPLFDASYEPFRPNVWQQAMRALLHTLHFAVAYWIMLLAMYYNGYVIICIIIGAFIGAFVFQWERIGGDRNGGQSAAAGPSRDATGCCG
ncbi:putative ctr copper transporter family protein [Eutypa lata UCREL1]|uniref:Copper transport protein n=1 Tax=Eutypa lata (strain UCR-EL1) TaxID=1287681 RepID=M7T469_EUTLA|nr:putative ctr copper transporter family protein [Eutypa lata UCREL1]